jgi:signal peptidase I
MKKAIMVTSSNVIRNFLPLDKYGIELINYPICSDILARIKESDIVMFSLLSFWDLKMFATVNWSGVLKDKTTIVGGAFLNTIKKPEQLLDHFDINHLCIGKGERFIQSLCEGKPVGQVYYEDKPVSQFDILMDNKTGLGELRELSLLSNYQCRWNRCLFCHHAHDNLRNCIDSPQLREIAEVVRSKGNLRRLQILDNDIDINFIIENILEDEKLMSQLECLDIFGIRCTSQASKLEKYINRYKDTTFIVNFGLEFVSQFFIDLYHKGYNLGSFLKKSRYLFSNDYKNLRVHMYCLLGMPLMDSDYYAELANFAGQHRHIGFKLSYFLMDDAIMNNFGAFDGLEVLGNIKVNEFSSMGNMPAIDTVHRHFLHGGESQYHHFKNVLEPSGLLRHRNTSIGGSLYPFAFRSSDQLWLDYYIEKGKGWLTVKTGSMAPLIHPGDRVLMSSVVAHEIREGDIVVFSRGGSLIVHRVLKKVGNNEETYFVEKGDNSLACGTFNLSDVIGRVNMVQRRRNMLNLSSPLSQLISRALSTWIYHTNKIAVRLRASKNRSIRRMGGAFLRLSLLSSNIFIRICCTIWYLSRIGHRRGVKSRRGESQIVLAMSKGERTE